MIFSEKQQEYFLQATRRWNIKSGATRSGKTYGDYFVIPKRIRGCKGQGHVVLLGNTESTLERNILAPMRKLWGSSLVGTVRANNKVNLFGKEAYALGASKANSVDKIQGASIEYCYGDEITTWAEPVFQMLKSRLDRENSKFDGTCNPANPLHWLKSFIESDADIYHQKYTIDDNPFLPEAFVTELKKEYTGVYYSRFILGNWEAAEGAVYDMFNKDRHIVPTVARDYTEYYVSIDYGVQNPMTYGLWGKHNNVWYKVKEYYYNGRDAKRQKTDEEYYKDLVAFIDDLDIRAVIIDPSATSFIATIRHYGAYNVVKADNAVMDGIQSVSKALNTGAVKYNDCCKHTFEEFYTYSWDDRATKRGEDAPRKENDHCMDSDRYFIHTILNRHKGIYVVEW